MTQEKTVFMSIRIPEDLKANLKFNALEKKMTLKKYICNILWEEVLNGKQVKKRKTK